MRILFVTDNRFWRRSLGSHRRIASMVEYLLERGYLVEVVFAGYLYPDDIEVLSKAPTEFTLHTWGERKDTGSDPSPLLTWAIAKRVLRQLAYEFARAFRKKPAGSGAVKRRFTLQLKEPKLGDFEAETTLEEFRRICGDYKPDAIVIEYVRLAWLLRSADDVLPATCLKLIDTHDVQYERQSRFHARGEVHDIDITPGEERQALAAGDIVIAIQQTDAATLRRLVPEKQVIVAGFPCEVTRHATRVDGPTRIGFFGSPMLPNRQAAEKLMREIYPRLTAQVAGTVELHVFGGVCSTLAHQETPFGVFLHGFVEDLSAAYAGLDVIANPVDFGGGLKIKNVEALCHGRPLVTTPIGAEGLEDGSGSAFLVATSDVAFVQLLGNLVDDKASRTALGDSALAFSIARFSEEAAYRQLESVLSSV